MRSVCIKALNQFFFIISLGRGFCTPRPSGVYFPIHPSSRQCTDTITACANLSLIYFTCEWKIFRFQNLWVEKIIRFGSSNELYWAVEKNDLDSTDCVAHLLFRLASRQQLSPNLSQPSSHAANIVIFSSMKQKITIRGTMVRSEVCNSWCYYQG